MPLGLAFWLFVMDEMNYAVILCYIESYVDLIKTNCYSKSILNVQLLWDFFFFLFCICTACILCFFNFSLIITLTSCSLEFFMLTLTLPVFSQEKIWKSWKGCRLDLASLRDNKVHRNFLAKVEKSSSESQSPAAPSFRVQHFYSFTLCERENVLITFLCRRPCEFNTTPSFRFYLGL